MNSYTSIIPGSYRLSPWYVCSHANPGAETCLIFFPYAGGGPSVFSKWLGELPSYLEGYIAHYPGRGSRYREPPIKRLSALVEGLYHAVRPLLDKPFAFFGHSMGGLVAFELARLLYKNKLPRPTTLFVSACGAPHLPDPHQAIHTLPDAEFLNSLRQLNGIPSELSGQSELIQLLTPMLRADFEAVENYHYVPDESPLDVPITVFGGLDDPRVSPVHLEGWALHTNSHFKLQYFPGDHFFINTARESVIDSIASELEASHAKD